MLFSIIIPVYNVQKYLEQCLDSILNQTIQDYEVIMIDDCSSDYSREIASKYAGAQPKLNLYCQDSNQGPSAARNVGLEHAKGKYVIFIDSDDWVSNDLLEKVKQAIYSTQSDSIIFQYKRIVNSEIIEKLNASPGTYHMNSDSRLFISLNSGLIGKSFLKCFRMDIIKKHNIHFLEQLKKGEDAVFDLTYFNYVKKFVILPDFLYFYRYNNLSITNKYYEDKLSFHIQHYRIENSILESWGIMDDEGKYIRHINFLFMLFDCLKNILHPKSVRSFPQCMQDFRNIAQNQFVIKAISGGKRKFFKGMNFRIRILIIMFFLKLYFLVYIMIKTKLIIDAYIHSGSTIDKDWKP